MVNPYRMVERWPTFGSVVSGAAIGIIPDGKGGTWLHHRSEPPIMHFDAAGNILKRFGDGMFVQAHGFCQDRDGNFWAGDSGPFADNPEHGRPRFPDVQVQSRRKGPADARQGRRLEGRSRHVHRSDGVRHCAQWRHRHGGRALAAADRRRSRTAIVLSGITKDGKFVSEFGKLGSKPGEFMGPHALAFDSAGPALRRRSIEQPRADLRPGHEVRGRVAPLRPPERRRHPARTTR